MLSSKDYHKAYLKTYIREQSIIDKDNYNKINIKKFLSNFFLIFSPFVFAIVLNFALLNNNFNKTEVIKSNLFYKYFHDKNYNNFNKSTVIASLDLSDQISASESISEGNKFNLIEKLSRKISFYNHYPDLNATNEDIIKKNSNKLQLSSDINQRKNEFINIILPIAIDQNKKILAQRQRLIEIRNSLNLNKTIDSTDQKFIKDIAAKYRVDIKNKHKIDTLDNLLVLIDIIPNSIVLAQAANESGWGSSRFAKEYNALFGQYTYDEKSGIIPAEREEGKKHLVRHFSSINKSVEAYFKNINTNPAYKEFRILRKKLKEKEKFLPPLLLVKALNVYAEDKRYVNTITSIIRDNKLTQYDNIPSI